MSAVRFRVAIWLRHRWVSIALTALVVGVLGGSAMGVVAGTRRTDSAPDRLTRAAGGDPDLYLTQMGGDPLIDRVADISGVMSSNGYAFVLAFPISPVDGSAVTDLNPFAGTDDMLGSRIIEGRFTDPSNPDEFTVNRALAADLKRRFGTKVGDRFPIAAFSRDQLRSDLDLETVEPAVAPFEATLVGITESPSDFDEAGSQLIFSRAFLSAHSDVGIVQTLIVADVSPGVDTRDVLNEVRRLPGGEDAYSSPLRVVNESARRAVRFQTTSLWLVCAFATLAAAGLTVQVASRTLRGGPDERRTVHALGWTRRDLSAERAIEGAAIGIAAIPIAALLAYFVTAAFPLGVLGAFEPHPGPRLDIAVTWIGALAVVVVASATGATVGWRSGARRAATTRASYPAPLAVTQLLGWQFASMESGGRRTWRSTIGGVVGVTCVVGSVVTAASLSAIAGDGARWGENFDDIFGNPYAPADRDIVGPVAELDAVGAATGAILGSVTINGVDTPAVGLAPAKGRLLPKVLSGRDVLASGEIGLGAEVMRRLDVAVGDSVEVAGVTGETQSLVVVGVVVTPGSAGNGSTMTFDTYQALNPEATQNVVMVDYRPGVSSSQVRAAREAIYSPPDSLTPPTTIKALERVTATPLLLAGVVTTMLIIGGAYLLTASVRSRRRDFATISAMGAVRHQVRSIVHWQATFAAVAAITVGIPIGVLVGRRVVQSLTTALGIVPGTDIPWVTLTAAAVGAVIAANAIALIPARRSAIPGVEMLRRQRNAE